MSKMMALQIFIDLILDQQKTATKKLKIIFRNLQRASWILKGMETSRGH